MYFRVPAFLWVMPFFTLLWSTTFAAEPVESRVQQARQFQESGLRTDPTAPAAASSLGSGGTESSASDDLSFGEQQILKRQEAPRYFDAFATLSAFYTNNVALTHRDGLDDGFLVGALGLSYLRPLTDALRAEFSLSGSTYRYDKFTELDFHSVDAGAGLVYRAHSLGDTELFVRYGFTELLSGDSRDEFYTGHAFTVGAQKAFALSRAHGVYVGTAATFNLSDPARSERNEFGAYAGYHLQATRNLSADVLYRASYQHYAQAGRRDVNQLAALTLRYALTDWLNLSGTTSFSVNSSNQTSFRYDVLNAGGGLALDVRF